jgi:tryptophan synthase alpha subunit
MQFEVAFFYASCLVGFILHEYMQVLLTTPTTPNERMEKIAQASEGFIYLVSFSDSVDVKNLFCYIIPLFLIHNLAV